eukprot:624338-Pelagomonas_calceolata.AAC.1
MTLATSLRGQQARLPRPDCKQPHPYANHVEQAARSCNQEKCLAVNTKKSEVVCFNSRADTLPRLYDGDSLPYTESFKYLGMVCDRRLNLSTAAEAALKP